MTEPRVDVVAYEVSCLPADRIEAPVFTLRVERRSVTPDRWCVSDGAFCYALDGTTEYEPIPSSRTDKFRTKYWHRWDDAIALAKRIAPTMSANGLSAEDILARSTEPGTQANSPTG